MLDACDEVIVAQSCDKNFSVYRDRVGSLFVKTPVAEATRDGDGPRLPARARDVVDAARSWRRRGRTSSSRIPSFARAGWSSSTAMRDRINAVRQRIAAADPRLAFIGRQFGMFSMLPLSQGAGAEAARGRMRSTWPTAAASTSSAWATTRSTDLPPPWSSALDALTHGRPRPGQSVRRRGLARGREAGPDQPRDGPDRGEELVPAKKVLYQFSARGHDMAQVLLGLQLKDGDGGLRLLSLAAAAAGARRAAGRCAWAPAWASPAAIRTGAISASCSIIPIRAARMPCRCAAASARNIRRRPAGRRRSPTSSKVLERRAGGRDRGGARRRRELRDRRILVGANNCHDATIADAHSTSRTMATASRCRRNIRRRARTSRPISRASPA